MIRKFKLCMAAIWPRQLFSRLCYHMRARRLVRVVVLVLLLLLYCEFIHYYLVLLGCSWPVLNHNAVVTGQQYINRHVRIMLIGDTHILGSKAHWFDKLRREWQMARSFQASMLIYSPDVVFILGDLLDEGKSSSSEEFKKDSNQFKAIFKTPSRVRTEILVGNHDIGFHYTMTDRKHDRFVEEFHAPSVQLLRIRGVIFVLINSVALEGDSCNICQDTVEKLNDIKWKLKCSKAVNDQQTVAKECDSTETFAYTKPILLQHFPLYRASDENCSTPDAAPDDEKSIPFKERLDCLSKESTNMLFEMVEPRLAITAHTHHGCYRVHDNGVPEYTVASFNWRNKKSPTFLLAEISAGDFAVRRCYLPNETTVISIYISGAFLLILCIFLPTGGRKSAANKELIFVKSH